MGVILILKGMNTMNQELEILLDFIGIAILGFGMAYLFVYVLPELI